MYDIKGEADSRGLEVGHVRDTVVTLLRARSAKHILVSDHEIQFRGPWLTDSWNMLAVISVGHVTVEGKDERVHVSWKLSLSRLRVSCVVFSLASLLLLCSAWWQCGTLLLVLVPFVLLLLWGWLYGMNWVLTSVRFHSLMQQALRE